MNTRRWLFGLLSTTGLASAYKVVPEPKKDRLAELEYKLQKLTDWHNVMLQWTHVDIQSVKIMAAASHHAILNKGSHEMTESMMDMWESLRPDETRDTPRKLAHRLSDEFLKKYPEGNSK